MVNFIDVSLDLPTNKGLVAAKCRGLAFEQGWKNVCQRNGSGLYVNDPTKRESTFSVIPFSAAF